MHQVDNVYIINLDKDTERLENTIEECKKISSKYPIRVPGVYGKELPQEIIDKHTSYFYSKFGLKSAIGCAMSHISAWKKIVENDDQNALILEDDVSIDPNFASKFKELKVPEDFYIIYLGCTIGCDIEKSYSVEYPIAKLFIGNPKKVVKINENVFIPALPLALHGYILSRKGAEYLIRKLQQDKIHSHIDAQILKYISTVPSYAVNPQLIYQKDIDIETSNNTASVHFPVLLNNMLSSKDSNGVPLNYKVNIGIYQFGGYTVNGVTGLFFFTGILLGLIGIKVKNVLVFFAMFSLIEGILAPTHEKFLVNSIVSLCILLVGYQLSSTPNLFSKLKK